MAVCRFYCCSASEKASLHGTASPAALPKGPIAAIDLPSPLHMQYALLHTSSESWMGILISMHDFAGLVLTEK